MALRIEPIFKRLKKPRGQKVLILLTQDVCPAELADGAGRDGIRHARRPHTLRHLVIVRPNFVVHAPREETTKPKVRLYWDESKGDIAYRSVHGQYN